MFVLQMLDRARERLATIGAGEPVRQAAELMSRPHTDLLVVCDGADGMVGVLTKTDIVKHIRHCGGNACMASVDTIMTREVFSCGQDELLRDIWTAMRDRGLQRIPVVDGRGKPIGIIYARDALQNLLGEVADEEALLRDYVMSVGYQ